MTSQGRLVQRHRPVLVPGSHVSAGSNQEVCEPELEVTPARVGRFIRRTQPVVVPGSRIGAVLDQEPRKLQVTPLNSYQVLLDCSLQPQGAFDLGVLEDDEYVPVDDKPRQSRGRTSEAEDSRVDHGPRRAPPASPLVVVSY